MTREEAERIADMLCRTDAHTRVIWGVVGLLVQLNGDLSAEALRVRALAPPPSVDPEDW